MILRRRFLTGASTILLCAGLCAAADFASAKRAYQEKEYGTAFAELMPLAEQGNPDAQLLLGRMYWAGQGVQKDDRQGLKWVKASATQGNADAQFFIGSYYLLPRRDVAEGLRWLKISAEQGNQDAQLLVGKSYLAALPELPRDPVQGEMWLRLAAKDNLPFYESQLVAAEKEMSPEEIAKGKALAAAWKPKSGLKSDER